MATIREEILEAYEAALEAESKRHNEALAEAKKACLQALKAERSGVKEKANEPA